jgi:hypothetical protein
MADKSFGVKQLNLIGIGTPTIESPSNINLDAVNVAISTDATVGRNLNVTGIVTASEARLGSPAPASSLAIINGSGVNITGVVTASTFIKYNGTSSQFLKADGSVDSSTYLTSETQTLNDVLGLGNTSSTGLSVGVVTATSFVKSSNSGGFLKADGTEDTSTYLTSYAETDPVVAAINGIVKSNGTTISAATAGTDYLTPSGDGSGLTGIVTNIQAGSNITVVESPTGNFIVTSTGSGGISSVSQDTSPQLGGDLDLNSNNITGTGSINITGGASFTGNVTIGGTLTYEDVTNIDSIGLITARSGIIATGVVTATSFVKSSGTSSQFLKADGSVDSSTYLTTETQTLDNVVGLGSTTTQTISVGNNAGTTGVTINPSGSLVATSSVVTKSTFYTDDSAGGNSTYSFGPSTDGLLISNASSTYPDITLTPYTGGFVISSGIVSATGFSTSGGTSSQFLKADGSVDSSTYISSIGISSAGNSIGNATTLNFIGTGNTFAVNGNTIDISIAGGGGGGGSGFGTYFSEQQSTSSPNNVDYVSSFTGIGATTDIDVALVPKGTGAILGNIPDGTATGGNKRGENAVDLQLNRSSASQVASGQYSAIIGGNNNSASAQQSAVVGGTNNATSAWQSFMGGGSGNTIGGGADASAIIGGYSNVVNVPDVGCGIFGSQYSQCKTSYSTILGGYYNEADAISSVVIGGISGSTKGIEGIVVFPANYRTGFTLGTGEIQATILNVAKQTANATPTVLVSNNSSAGSNNQMVLKNNSALAFKGTCIAGVTGAGNTKAWEFRGAIKRGANAASTTLVGSVIKDVLAYDAGAAAWDVDFTADTTDGALKVTVTGQASTTIRWVCKIETTEMAF